MGTVLFQFVNIRVTIECFSVTVEAQAQKVYHLRSVYTERGRGLAAFAKEWSK